MKISSTKLQFLGFLRMRGWLANLSRRFVVYIVYAPHNNDCGTLTSGHFYIFSYVCFPLCYPLAAFWSATFGQNIACSLDISFSSRVLWVTHNSEMNFCLRCFSHQSGPLVQFCGFFFYFWALCLTVGECPQGTKAVPRSIGSRKHSFFWDFLKVIFWRCWRS